MKKNILFLASFAAFFSSAQAQVWTTATGQETTPGKVGIGTITPSTQLDIVTNQADGGITARQNGGGASFLFLDNASGRKWGIGSTGSGNNIGGGHYVIYDITNSIPHFLINGSTGKVGIGNPAPSYKLDLVTSTNADDGIIMSNTGSGKSGLFLNQASTGRLFGMSVDATGNFELKDMTMNESRLFFTPAGNLGIGTTTPSNRVEVLLGTTSDDGVAVKQYGNGKSGIFLKNVTFNRNWGLLSDLSGNFTIKDVTANADRMFINSSGQVSIGPGLQASSPHYNNYKLAVKGKIVSQEVVVTQISWADFVFDKGYKLMSLEELERFYKKNHHLPDVPCTSEIADGGNDLGKTDAILLQKIEELTLYIVELKKQVDALKK